MTPVRKARNARHDAACGAKTTQPRPLADLLCRFHHPAVCILCRSLFSGKGRREEAVAGSGIHQLRLSLAGPLRRREALAWQRQWRQRRREARVAREHRHGRRCALSGSGQGRFGQDPRRNGAVALQPGRPTHRFYPDGPPLPIISLREAGFFNPPAPQRPSRQSSPPCIRSLPPWAAHPYNLRIEGHTDNIPIHTAEFDSNWELSSARATHIARIFLDLNAMPPERISAAGYAEFHPVAGNDTPEGRAQNRRVDLIVLPRTTIDLSAPAATEPAGPWRKITDGP